MAPAESYDDERHRREEQERREKRKAAKAQKSVSQKEKLKKRKDHVQKILQKHGGGEKKKQKTETQADKSAFQELFKQRAQGFEIEFRFKNAPPRPPVGPNFVGSGLDGVLMDLSQYKPLNAVEVNYTWKLHSEPDLGVPLAPSAMDPKSYEPSAVVPPTHPDDKALLEWKGSMGDSAAEELKIARYNARAAARIALTGKSSAALSLLQKAQSPSASTTPSGKKNFSRVLDETMQSWMKKTTYLSNDYSRKVHDFKSLAKTKAEVAQDLEVRQQQISQRRSASAISKTFEEVKQTVTRHPSKEHLKPINEMPFLPNVEHWGHAYTHVVMDKSPGYTDSLDKAFVANVQKKDVNARMTCHLFVPPDNTSEEDDAPSYQPIQQFELDVLPLKEEDAPHVNFCIWVDPDSLVASYLPISSRVQLSTGRPLQKRNYHMKVSRRAANEEDVNEMNERVAEIDLDVEKKLFGNTGGGSAMPVKMEMDDGGAGENSDHDDSFLNTAISNTIVAES